MFDARVLEEHGVTFSIGHSTLSHSLRDWDVSGFEKISLRNLLGDIFSGRCSSFTLRKTWGVLGKWGPQTSDDSIERIHT